MPASPLRPAALLICLALLGACQRETEALEPAPEKAPAGVGADVAALGPAPIAPLGAPVAEAFSYPERAYAVDHAFWGRAPSYAFVNETTQGYAWRTRGDWRRLAEPTARGWRFVYYAPDRPHPFFVRDGARSYAFDDAGRLVAVYDGKGALAPAPAPEEAPPAELAGRYLAHAANLAAAEREERFEVDRRVWESKLPALYAPLATARYAAQTTPAWRAWRIETRGRDLALVLQDPKLIRSAFVDPRPKPKPAPAPAIAAPAASAPAATAPAPSGATTPAAAAPPRARPSAPPPSAAPPEPEPIPEPPTEPAA